LPLSSSCHLKFFICQHLLLKCYKQIEHKMFVFNSSLSLTYTLYSLFHHAWQKLFVSFNHIFFCCCFFLFSSFFSGALSQMEKFGVVMLLIYSYVCLSTKLIFELICYVTWMSFVRTWRLGFKCNLIGGETLNEIKLKNLNSKENLFLILLL